MKRRYGLWMVGLLLGGLAHLEVVNAQNPPPLEVVGPPGCVRKGSQLRLRGLQLGDSQAGRRVVLRAGAVEVEAQVLTWRDTEVLIRIPDDPQLKEGGRYDCRVVQAFGEPPRGTGPELLICRTTKTPTAATPVANPAAAQARQLVSQVLRASGAGAWRDVKRLQFTFRVAQGAKDLVTAQHDWHVRDQTDQVTWGGKTVTVNLRQPAADADSQAAYKRWVNDSYWLLMPLKLADPGTQVTYVGRTTLAGKPYDTLRLSFGPVGLTSKDQYAVYVDPATALVAYWDYQPDETHKVSGTWEQYQDFGGLKLSTEHQFGDKHVWFTDVKVEK